MGGGGLEDGVRVGAMQPWTVARARRRQQDDDSAVVLNSAGGAEGRGWSFLERGSSSVIGLSFGFTLVLPYCLRALLELLFCA